jgi:hypothetical protein
MANGYDKFLTETSGMGSVPNAHPRRRGLRSKGRSGWKARAMAAGRAYKAGPPARNKPNSSRGEGYDPGPGR